VAFAEVLSATYGSSRAVAQPVTKIVGSLTPQPPFGRYSQSSSL
jgi:hypothetical protein